jgi:glycosyltransferase involved in cell wall biosynthesis
MALSDEFHPVIFAPPGEAVPEARRMGIEAHTFENLAGLANHVTQFLALSREIAYLATGVSHSLLISAANLAFHRRVAHLHVVHGGTDESLSYGRKRLLSNTGVHFVAVSRYVRERLSCHGVPRRLIHVLENFLPKERISLLLRRPKFAGQGVRRAVMVSRMDPIKRVDVLMDALQQMQPAVLRVDAYGAGWELEANRERAQQQNLSVEFHGFELHVESKLAQADLLIHTCPEEPFGLAILEAMAAGLPVLVPSTGGAATLVEDGVTGFHFAANEPAALAAKLREVASLSAERLNEVVDAADALMASRFSQQNIAAQYRGLIAELLN